jgi:hypothetical protein
MWFNVFFIPNGIILSAQDKNSHFMQRLAVRTISVARPNVMNVVV